MNLSPELQADLVAGMRAAVPKICPRCDKGQGISMYNPEFHALLDSRGQEVGCTDCKATAERALLARVDAEVKHAE